MRADHTRARMAAVLGASISAVAAGVLLVGGPMPVPARGATIAAKAVPGTPARGIDVSSYQHPGGASINWRAVARAGYRFAFITATEGTYYVNPYFKADAAAAKAAGLLVATYHFANPANSGGKAQADYAISHGDYQSDGRTLRMILDIERDPYLAGTCYGLNPGQMVSWISAFMIQAHRRTRLWPVINTQPAWWNKCTGDSTAFAADQLWVQDHRRGDTRPRLPSGWTSWAYWQYSITGRVPGVTGDTDLNELNPALLAVADPGSQSYQAGRRVRVPVRSLNRGTGQALSYSVTGLPAGLSLNPATGVIHGTLTSSLGSTSVAVTVSAAGATPVTWRFGWHVHGGVTLTAPAAQASRAGSHVRLRVKSHDGLPGCTLWFTAKGLPPGLSMSSCGLITGRPRRAGTYHCVVAVTDSTAAVLASVTFTWQIS